MWTQGISPGNFTRYFIATLTWMFAQLFDWISTRIFKLFQKEENLDAALAYRTDKNDECLNSF